MKGAIAYGGLGCIYLDNDLTLSRWVVLKGLLNSSDDAAAAVAERQFLASVKHANIVGIYNFAKRGSEGFIVMEYVSGATVKDVLKSRGPLPSSANELNKMAARREVLKLTADGGTAMSTWLAAAAREFLKAPAAIHHALLLTDGKNEGEKDEVLAEVVHQCEGKFQCDARGPTGSRTSSASSQAGCWGPWTSSRRLRKSSTISGRFFRGRWANQSPMFRCVF